MSIPWGSWGPDPDKISVLRALTAWSLTKIGLKIRNLRQIVIIRGLLKNCTKRRVDWGFVPDPTGELTALPHICTWISGVCFTAGTGKRREGIRGERKEEGKGGRGTWKGWTLTVFGKVGARSRWWFSLIGAVLWLLVGRQNGHQACKEPQENLVWNRSSLK